MRAQSKTYAYVKPKTFSRAHARIIYIRCMRGVLYGQSSGVIACVVQKNG